MPPRRVVNRIEFLATDGVRLELDRDGWRLVKPRQLGQAQLERARELIERAEAVVAPERPDFREDPDPLATLADHAAGVLGLRITHRRFTETGSDKPR